MVFDANSAARYIHTRWALPDIDFCEGTWQDYPNNAWWSYRTDRPGETAAVAAAPATQALPRSQGSDGVRPLTAATWYLNDDLAAAVGRHLVKLDDVTHFEMALRRPVAGLYPQLFGGYTHRVLTHAREGLQRYAANHQQLSPNRMRLPDWADRALLHHGLSPFVDESPRRMLWLYDKLRRLPYAELPLASYLAEQATLLMGAFRADGLAKVTQAQKTLARLVPNTAAADQVFSGVQESLLQFVKVHAYHLHLVPEVDAAWRQVQVNLLQSGAEGVRFDEAQKTWLQLSLYDFAHALQVAAQLPPLEVAPRPTRAGRYPRKFLAAAPQH